MKKFVTLKVTFETYISVPFDANGEKIKESISEKLSDKLEMYCTDNGFAFTEHQTTLEIQE
jgi:hypothetical protein